MYRKTYRVLAAACLLALTLINCAAAQESVGDQQWKSQCKEATCSLSLGLVDSNTKKRFATLAFLFEKGKEEPAVVVTTPLGVALEPGVRVIVGDDSFDLKAKVCFPDGCQASLVINRPDFDRIAKMPNARIQFFPFSSSTPIEASVPLNGLPAAVDTLPLN